MIFLQAAIQPARQYATMQAIEDNRLMLCTSPELLAEIRDVLTRPALTAKFSELTSKRVAQFLDNVNLVATTFTAVPNVFTWPQHPDDDHLLNLVIEAQPKYLVTWETRILKLATDTTPAATLFRQLAPHLAIITPAQLAELLKTQQPHR